MPEFFALSREDQREVLLTAAERSARPMHLLEKDVWVVWALRHLFAGPHAQHLVFKGGTSLSKAYGVIRRFSEDVDLTYDIRAIAPDLIGNAQSSWPASRSQEKKWSKTIRQRLADLINGTLAPELAAALAEQGLPAKARAEGEHIFIDYEALAQGTGYVLPSLLLEFGARSTGEPHEPRPVRCDAAEHLSDASWPRPWRHTRASSSPSRRRTARRSITEPRSPERWFSHPAATRGAHSPRTTSAWSKMACCWTTRSPSTPSSSFVRRSPTR